MFTIAQREALRDRLLRLAAADDRVVAGAAVGALAAAGGGDRFSDLDLTFAVADRAPAATVLDDWTRTLTGERAAVPLADLARGPTCAGRLLYPARIVGTRPTEVPGLDP